MQSVELFDYRNFTAQRIELSPSMTILCGPNATGKTNTVEALQLLTAGASFRHPKTQDLVFDGKESARVQALLKGDGRVLDVALEIKPPKRRFMKNGKACHAADLSSTLMSVLFCPDDLSLVKRGAHCRREELDAFGAEANAGFRKVCRSYARTLEQRNRLLKDEYVDTSLLDAWDTSLALGGATLLAARLRLFERLKARVVDIYASVSEGESLGCSYECSLGQEALTMSRDELTDLFAQKLQEARPNDLRRGQTSVGPQRDDIVFTLNGKEARTFGSQGQQRSVVLAWKMAEVGLAQEILGEQPLLLLDDVMSELDAQRREAVTRFVQSGIQTVVTTTNLGYFPHDLLEAAKVISYGA